MKKIAVIFLCFVSIFLLLACGSGSKREVNDCENAVAVMTIHSFDGSYGALPLVPNFGHSFISVKNISANYLQVGKFILIPNEEVSIGTWVTTAHGGVWYNLESNYYQEGKYDTTATLSKRIDFESVNLLTKHILENDRWEFSYNCTAFSLDAWNSVASLDTIKISGLVTPNALKKQMQKFSTAKGAQPIQNFTKSGYFDQCNQFYEYYLPQE